MTCFTSHDLLVKITRIFRETQTATTSFGRVASGRIVQCSIIYALMFLAKTVVLGLVDWICSSAEIV